MRNKIKSLVGLPMRRVRAFFSVPRLIDLRNIVAFVILCVLLAGGLAGWFVIKDNTLIDNWARGMFLSARLEAFLGEDEPGSVVDYTQADIQAYWGIETNSKWLVEYTVRIMPYFDYEGISYGVTPKAVVFVPYDGGDAFRVAGRALRDLRAVVINDRYVTDPAWNDQAELLAVLVHEIVHIQQGDFIGDNPDVFEAFTEAATAEILAAMCNYGDELSCRAFAGAMQGNVASTLRRDLNYFGLDGVYQAFSDLFMRDTAAEHRAEKVLRWWKDGRWGSLMEIVARYGATPLEDFIAPGLRGESFPTGVPLFIDGGSRVLMGHGLLVFDDTAVLLNRWGLLAWFLGY